MSSCEISRLDNMALDGQDGSHNWPWDRPIYFLEYSC